MIRRISALLIAAAALLPVAAAHGHHAPASAVALEETGASTAGGHTSERVPTHG